MKVQDDAITKILKERINAQRQGIGMVAGFINPQGRCVRAYGSMVRDGLRALSQDTMFEIGSATKVFTALLLCQMTGEGEVSLDDPVAEYLPCFVRVPKWNKRQITLADLATHTSGLPRLPSNLHPKDASNPYVGYTEDNLYEFLSSYELSREPGTQYEYSNLGGGLLGFALEKSAGKPWEELVRTRILDPLGMENTRVTLSSEMKKKLATGHNSKAMPVTAWDFGVLKGAGALRSCANDLLRFLEAHLQYFDSPLKTAISLMRSVQRPTGNTGMAAALGWQLLVSRGSKIIWHNGGTGGYRCFLGYDEDARTGSVVLSNMSTSAGVDDIGMHLLDRKFPLRNAPKERKEIAMDADLLDRYIGHYQLTPNFFLKIGREENQLFAQGTGQGRAPIFPESERDFFYKAIDAQISFEIPSEGTSVGLTLHQNGLSRKAKRIA